MTKTLESMNQHQKILMTMARKKDQTWFMPHDFMKPGLGELFVGYEASARLSELAKKYPEMIESKRTGKQIARRVKLEDIAGWIDTLPKDLRYVFHRTGNTAELRRRQETPTQPFITVSEYVAVWVGRKQHNGALIPNTNYTIEVNKLELGKPITVHVKSQDIWQRYNTIKEFNNDWRITNENS